MKCGGSFSHGGNGKGGQETGMVMSIELANLVWLGASVCFFVRSGLLVLLGAMWKDSFLGEMYPGAMPTKLGRLMLNSHLVQTTFALAGWNHQ
jgi:hypothetical protein